MFFASIFKRSSSAFLLRARAMIKFVLRAASTLENIKKGKIYFLTVKSPYFLMISFIFFVLFVLQFAAD